MQATVTSLVASWKQGDEAARDQLFAIVYDELRKLAHWQIQSERHVMTVQPTALVHEAYMRLAAGAAPDWEGRVHLMGAFARAMRNLLVDLSRRRNATKRGAGVAPETLHADLALPGGKPVDLMELDLALTRLESFDARKSRIIELRFFSGLDLEETARAMGLSVSTVRREQTAAQAWLMKELKGSGGDTISQ